MKNTMKKNCLFTALALICSVAISQAQFGSSGGAVVIGGGYLDKPGTAYGFGQIRGTIYEDDSVAHSVFLDILVHRDEAILEFVEPGGFSFFESGDISFVNITANYEVEAKLSSALSFYAGGGAGIELVSIDDRFDDVLDSDSNFVAQVFAGFRAHFPSGVVAQAGARYIFRDDFQLLGDQFITEDSVAFEASIGFRF
jgi:opacity protein-like surface antigen